MEKIIFIFTLLFASHACNSSEFSNQFSESFGSLSGFKEDGKWYLFQGRDSVDVYIVLSFIVGNSINANNLPGYDYSIEKEHWRKLFEKISEDFDTNLVKRKMELFYGIDEALKLPFILVNNIDDPFYFEEVISLEKRLNPILQEVLKSPDRSWSSLSSSESIYLRYKIIIYLINLNPKTRYNILSNYFSICESECK